MVRMSIQSIQIKNTVHGIKYLVCQYGRHNYVRNVTVTVVLLSILSIHVLI